MKPVYIVDGLRSPFLKVRGRVGPFSASDLAVGAGRLLLERQPFEPEALGEVVFGCVSSAPNEANIARVIALRLGCGDHVPAWTVQRNCASGLQAIDSAAKDIALGRHDLVLAGGTEAMSHIPLVFRRPMVDWLAQWRGAKGVMSRLRALTRFRLHYLQPKIALLEGLTDHTVAMNMGQTAEELAYRYGIVRKDMDVFALESHERVLAAQGKGHFSQEIAGLYDQNGHFYDGDTGVRADSSMEKLAHLRPLFDRPFGMITAGNSSQVTDGAAMVILASEGAVKRHSLPVLGRIVDVEWAALDPAIMGLGPVYAATPLLKRNKLALSAIDVWEINEAFAAQVLACLHVWEDEAFCRTELGLERALGAVDRRRLNVDGGAVALGHPVGASGARLVLHLLHVLQRKKAKRGIATLCIGGGQGGALLVERG